MQSFIKIRGAVLEKNGNKKMTLCNLNKDQLKNISSNQLTEIREEVVFTKFMGKPLDNETIQVDFTNLFTYFNTYTVCTL